MAKKQANQKPDVVSRAQIKRKVIPPLRRAATAQGASPPKIALLVNGDETLSLEDDLNLNEDMRKRLKADYNSIGEQFNPEGRRPVGQISAGKCETVEDSIDLTYNRANGRP